MDRVEEADAVELVKAKLIRAIMTGLLFLAGKICPDFIYAILKEIHAKKRTVEIIKLRYIDNEKFEAIPDLLKRRCELRQVFKIHKDFINELYRIVISRKYKS